MARSSLARLNSRSCKSRPERSHSTQFLVVPAMNASTSAANAEEVSANSVATINLCPDREGIRFLSPINGGFAIADVRAHSAEAGPFIGGFGARSNRNHAPRGAFLHDGLARIRRRSVRAKLDMRAWISLGRYPLSCKCTR